MSDLVLGILARDRVTNFGGTITARTEYLGGHVRLCVEDAVVDGKRQACWFDAARLEPIEIAQKSQ